MVKTMLTDQILKLLAGCAGYLSGEALSNTLGVSRNAVWKAVQKLRREGCRIDAVPNKGYMLLRQENFLHPALITPHTQLIGKNVLFFNTLPSTNKTAKENDMPAGTVVIADEQTAGKGRMGKDWVSAKGTGIWMSVAVRPCTQLERIMQLSLMAGLAVCEALNTLLNLHALIKWPNDIVTGGKKICGILTETVVEERRITKAVVGIGINVNTNAFPAELGQAATSVLLETGQPASRAEIICRVLERFEHYYLLLQSAPPDALCAHYKRLCVNIGRPVCAVSDSRQITGTAVDILPDGALLIQTEDGAAVPVRAGEVSVRGIYGYI